MEKEIAAQKEKTTFILKLGQERIRSLEAEKEQLLQTQREK